MESPLLAFALATIAIFRSQLDAQAIDGDTLRTAGEEIHLLGIDAPELHQSCRRSDGSAFFCGQEAARALAIIVAGGVNCEPTDRGNQAICRDRTGRDIGLFLARSGSATANDPNSDYGTAERLARTERIGIWEGSFLHPRIWRERTSSNPPILVDKERE